MKQKTTWACIECGQTSAKWAGQCHACGEWNSIQEEIVKETYRKNAPLPSTPKPLLDIPQDENITRFMTGIGECDRLFGGGLVPGAFLLLGGEPGIGKSTLMLQLAAALSEKGKKVLYVCAEESISQTALRAKRLGLNSKSLLLFSEGSLQVITSAVERESPDVLIIDSIQIIYDETIASTPGSVAQVRGAAHELMRFAKERMMTTFTIGHVTKSGEIAGPRVLEHLVDTVLYFEGDRNQQCRLVRAIKNRFGPTDEIAVFQMDSQGLKEVPNPSQFFLEKRPQPESGTAIIPSIEGSRTLLVEVQALVSQSPFSTPARRSTGIDQNRLSLLVAVLEKRLRLPLFRHDIFVSIVGGLRVLEPGADLGIAAAIVSSLKNVTIPQNTLLVGEVGLTGEIRTAQRIENRLKEAINLGFKRCILPKSQAQGLNQAIQDQISLHFVDHIHQAMHTIFKN